MNAGIEIGLLNITFVGVAAALGISHMALYKHISSLEELKYMIAEEIFTRWEIPLPSATRAVPLKDYLLEFMHSIRELVKSNPGLTPYLIRRMASTPSMVAKIGTHHQVVAQAYSLSLDQARWLNSTIAFHCIAVADTIYTVAGKEPTQAPDRASEEAEMEAEFMDSMQALIIGTLALLETKK
ncbi:TetR/AcrR family transcriptional regulator [Acinetobacter sp. C26M]|uniref:TetR/AcrR family transcriptional regulator n=1 Tax=unclassified Acinetobacter TaxID=196816 RepID=UPI001D18F2C6|nr:MULTISPECIES: TetR/AcrR family transcriptional regulator [unclassified Acinetobacter]USA47495.1 TetR/AcrR family transcriptional regulator [Acinetobacter sp. C26M]USA50976.1 TetR/AcrR family transcriptional regulator [Acinetobacter sp. C26G]